MLALVPEQRRGTLIAQTGRRRSLPVRHRAPGAGRNGVLRCVAPGRSDPGFCTGTRDAASMPERPADAAASLRAVQRRFGAAERVQAMLDVEAALARGAGRARDPAVQAAQAIAQAARAERLRPRRPSRRRRQPPATSRSRWSRRSRTACAPRTRTPRAFVHWGATSQDIIDTGLVLQLARRLSPSCCPICDRAAAAAAAHARRHASTPMAGRTWLQQATPTTFGLKAAGWLDALGRGERSACAALAAAACVLQFGGAVGHPRRARRARPRRSPNDWARG